MHLAVCLPNRDACRQTEPELPSNVYAIDIGAVSDVAQILQRARVLRCTVPQSQHHVLTLTADAAVQKNAV